MKWGVTSIAEAITDVLWCSQNILNWEEDQVHAFLSSLGFHQYEQLLKGGRAAFDIPSCAELICALTCSPFWLGNIDRVGYSMLHADYQNTASREKSSSIWTMRRLRMSVFIVWSACRDCGALRQL